MKKTLKFLFLIASAVSVLSFFSCKDNFDDSIFDTRESIDYLDQSLYTFPLDTFIKKEFLEPYNLKFMYRFEDKGSDMSKNLTPAKYDKCVDLAVLTKYLWYDIYKEQAGEKEEFLKKYSPRVIHVCGSQNYNASQGTTVGGDASGGIKINLYNVNALNPENIDDLNEIALHVMHHEFTHILDQTVQRPQKFNVISNGKYDSSWSNADDSLKAGVGFVTPYASSAVSEDWAEIVANYVTLTPEKWNDILSAAEYDWEEIDIKGGYGGEDYRKYWQKKVKYGCDYDTIGHIRYLPNGDLKVDRRMCKRDDNDNVILEPTSKTLFNGTKVIEAGKPYTIPNVDWTTVSAGNKLRLTAEVVGTADSASFDLTGVDCVIAEGLKWDVATVTVNMEIELTQAMLDKICSQEKPQMAISGNGFTLKTVELAGDSKVQWIHTSDESGRKKIEDKLELAVKYMNDEYKIDLDKLRHAVLSRTYKTDASGKFVKDAEGNYVNLLMEKQEDGRTLMDHLRDMVNQYKK